MTAFRVCFAELWRPPGREPGSLAVRAKVDRRPVCRGYHDRAVEEFQSPAQALTAASPDPQGGDRSRESARSPVVKQLHPHCTASKPARPDDLGYRYFGFRYAG